MKILQNIVFFFLIYMCVSSFWSFSQEITVNTNQKDSSNVHYPKKNMNLEDCINYAVKHNTDLEIQKIAIDLQKIDYKQTRNNALPNFNTNITYGFNFGRSIDPTSNQFEQISTSYTSVGANANLNLYNGLKLKRQKIQGALQVNASEYDYLYQKDELALKIAQAYLNVVLGLELLKNDEIQVETNKKQLEKTKVLVLSGIQPKSAEISANSAYVTSNSQLVSSKNNLTLQYLRLKQLMRMDVNDPLEVEIPKDMPILNDIPLPDEVYKLALNVQKNIKSSTLKEKIAIHAEEIAESDYYPTLSLNASVRSNYSGLADQPRNIIEGVETKQETIGVVQTTNNPVVSDVSKPKIVGQIPNYSLFDQLSDNFSQSLNLNLSIPIFNKFRVRNNVQRARVQKYQAELYTWLAKQNLRQRIEQAYQQAVSAYENYNAAKKNLDALQESFRTDEERHQSGILDVISFEISKNRYFSAKNTLTQRKYEYLFRILLLKLYAVPFNYE